MTNERALEMQTSGEISPAISEKSDADLTGLRDDAEMKGVSPLACDNDKSDSKNARGGLDNTGTNSIDEKRLVRRIDYTLVPWLAFLYLLCYLDRSGIGNARLYGMEDDLNISDKQYLVCLTLFFIPYSLLEVPANILLKRLRPSIWLSATIFLWGVCTVVQGLVSNFGGLLAVRLFLGTFEAGFSPGAAYYLSCWYKRDELGIRIAVFASSVAVAGAFGGLLAAAISNMDGVGGKPAWAWIFIIEGLVTVVAGATSFVIIQDFPESARFLSEQERTFVVHRLQTDDQFSAAGEQLRWSNVRKSLVDWKTWLAALCMIGSSTPNYAFAFFLPTIVSMLGFTATRANLLVVPVYVVASIGTCIVGFAGDRLRRRGYFSIGLTGLIGVGFIVLLCSRSTALSYFAIYVAVLGTCSIGPNTLAWISNNVEGSYKRAVSVAIIFTAGNLTGIISTNTYRAGDRPWYTTGHGITFSIVAVGHLAAIALHILLKKENERRDRGERDEVITGLKGGDPQNGCYDSVEAAKLDKGDEWSGYRYIT